MHSGPRGVGRRWPPGALLLLLALQAAAAIAASAPAVVGRGGAVASGYPLATNAGRLESA